VSGLWSGMLLDRFPDASLSPQLGDLHRSGTRHDCTCWTNTSFLSARIPSVWRTSLIGLDLLVLFEQRPHRLDKAH